MTPLEPLAGQRPGYAPPSLRRVLLLLLVVFAAGNGLVVWFVRAAGVEAVPADLQSRLAYRARVDGFFGRAREQGEQRAVFVGDSLVHGAHLRERHGADWPRFTLSEQFAGSSGRQVWAALNLGIDGVLFSDLRCVVEDVLARRPDLLVVVVSPRPFAAEFADGSAESARPFLCEALSARPLARAGQVLADLTYRAVPAYRYRDLLQLAYLDTTPRAFLLAKLTPLLASVSDSEDPDESAVLAQAMQRMRAAQRLNSVHVREDHPQARALHELLRALREQDKTRVVVLYLRENLSVLGESLDAPRYEAEAQRFSELLTAALSGAAHCKVLVAPASDYAGEYVDHIHLTAAGYARLAEQVHKAWEHP